MAFNLSILKEIDFTNNENLLFLGILSVLVIIAISIIVIIIRKIIRAIRKLIIRIFNIEVRKPQFNQKTSEWLHKSKKPEDTSTERKNAPKPELEFIGNFNAGEKKQEAKDAEKDFKEKEAKDIAESLSKLEAVDDEKKETVQSKMPSRSEEPEDPNKKIEVPRPKRFQATEENKNVPPAPSKQNPTNGFSKVAVTSSHGTIRPPETVGSPHGANTPPAINFDKNGSFLKSSALQGGGNPLQKPDFLEDNLSPHSAHRSGGFRTGSSQIRGSKEVAPGAKEAVDTSIFGGKSEVSREKLEEELEEDVNVWKAARQEGLNFTPEERAGLVKKIFSPVYGRNISRTDLKQGLKKLNEKLMGTKDMTEHAKIRKEIKFFKKIGGIK